MPSLLERPSVRFVLAYIGASLAASVPWVAAAILWPARHGPNDVAGFSLLYVAMCFLYTLLLGILGWSVLLVAGLRGWTAYAGIGVILGLVAGGISNKSPVALPVCAFTGLVAALVFRSIFYRKQSVESPAAAA